MWISICCIITTVEDTPSISRGRKSCIEGFFHDPDHCVMSGSAGTAARRAPVEVSWSERYQDGFS